MLFAATLGVAVISVVAFVLYLVLERTGAPIRVRVTAVEARDVDLAAYVAAYLLPFVAIFGADVQDVIALGLFLLFIGVLWVNSRLLYLNPLLALAGYHLYLANLVPTGTASGPLSTGGTQRFVLAHRKSLRIGDELRVVALAESAYLEQEKEELGEVE